MNTWKDTKASRFIPLLILVTINVHFVLFNFGIPNMDVARHLLDALNVYAIIENSHLGLLDVALFYDFYGHFPHIVSSFFIWLFGKSYTAITLSLSLFWLPLAYLYSYRILTEILNVERHLAGWVIFVVLGLNVPMSMSKQYLLDLPVLSLFAAYIYYLFKSDYFQNSKYSFLSGVVCGLGFMCKGNSLIYSFSVMSLFFPISMYMLYQLREKNYFVVFENMALHAIGVLFFAGVWLLAWGYLYQEQLNTVMTTTALAQGDPDVWTWASNIYYAQVWKSYWTFPGLILISYGLYRSLSDKNTKFISLFSIYGFIVSYLFIASQADKDSRTMLASLIFALPFIAILFKTKRNENTVLFSMDKLSALGLIILVIYNFTLPSGHAAPNRPNGPLYVDRLEAINVFKWLYSDYKPYETVYYDEIAAEQWANNYGYSFYTNSFYQQLYKPSFRKLEFAGDISHTQHDVLSAGGHKIKIARGPNQTEDIHFGRVNVWPTYYLFVTDKKSDTDFEFQQIGAFGRLGASIKVFAFVSYEDGSSEVVMQNLHGNAKARIKFREPVASLRVSYRASFVNGQWPLNFSKWFLSGHDFYMWDQPLIMFHENVDVDSAVKVL